MPFLFRRPNPLVSICIPVHNTEMHLGRCLDSLAAQEFKGLELVLINDQSTAKDAKGRSCKKIVQSFKRKSRIPVVYIEHTQYVPLLETRRELVEHAHGEYILMVDSDDYLADGAVKTLYDSALKTGSDITCGTDRIYQVKDGEVQHTERSFAVHTEGSLHGREILDSWLAGKTSAFLWAKLIRRELYLTAFASIPYMDCSLSVDTPMYFFIAYYAKTYYGISDMVYHYLANEGITSSKPITSLQEWRRHCSVASIFTLLLTFEGDLTEEEKEGIRRLSRRLISITIQRMNHQLSPSLRAQGRDLLCEYWGENYVTTVEQMMEASFVS